MLEARQNQRQSVAKTVYVQCPYCHSSNTTKISNISKGIALEVYGKYAIPKVSKQYHCMNCGADF